MPKTSKAKQNAKERILLATLEVIKKSGMRGVRHRAVAAEAAVSLGSTTYHFKNIEDLISSTFVYWHNKIDVRKNPHFASIEADVAHFTKEKTSSNELANKLYLDAEIYLRNQIFDKSEDRKIELAFHNEALRSLQLSSLLLKTWQDEVDKIVELFEAIDAPTPIESAELTFALVLQLEKKAMLIHDKSELVLAFEQMKRVLKHHIYSIVAGISNPL